MKTETQKAELLAMDRDCRAAIEELRAAARPHGIFPASVDVADDGMLTVHLDGDVNRHRITLHMAGVIVSHVDRHYEATIEGHVANVARTVRKLTAEFTRLSA